MTISELSDAVINGDIARVTELTKKNLEDGMPPEEIIEKGLIAGMDIVGQRFKKNEMYIPEVMVAARAMHAGMDILKPLLTESDITKKGIIVIGTVKGDVHDIGKNLVAMMMEGAGFEVHDLGIDVPTEKFVEAAFEHKADVIAASTLLTTTMDTMAEVVSTIKKEDSGLDNVMVIVGGAPVSEDFAKEIGADAYGENAGVGVDAVKQWLAEHKN